MKRRKEEERGGEGKRKGEEGQEGKGEKRKGKEKRKKWREGDPKIPVTYTAYLEVLNFFASLYYNFPFLRITWNMNSLHLYKLVGEKRSK